MQEKPFYVHIELHKKIVKNAWIISYEERKILVIEFQETVRRHIAMLLEDRILETEHPGDSRAYRIKDTKIVMVKEKKTNGNDNSK